MGFSFALVCSTKGFRLLRLNAQLGQRLMCELADAEAVLLLELGNRVPIHWGQLAVRGTRLISGGLERDFQLVESIRTGIPLAYDAFPLHAAVRDQNGFFDVSI